MKAGEGNEKLNYSHGMEKRNRKTKKRGSDMSGSDIFLNEM